MSEEKHTKDNEFNELKRLLKNLPKVNTPDNFEYNLMTKIKNKSFEIKSEKRKSWLSWSLTPALTFALSVFIIFFVFTGEEVPEDNPWNTLPELMEENVSEVEAEGLTVDKDEISKKEIAKRSKTQNLASTNKIKKDYPFEKESSINFDEYLKSDSPQSPDGGAQLAGSQKSNASPFDGFFLRQRRDARERDSLRKEKDSLSQQELDKNTK